MNKKSIFLTFLCAISTIQTVLPVQSEQQKGWYALGKAYATSLVSGGAIGGITGAFSAYAILQSFHGGKSFSKLSDNPTIEAAIFGLIIPAAVICTEYQLRSRLVDEVKQSFNENDINYKRNFISDAAWIASWVTFLSSPLFKQNFC